MRIYRFEKLDGGGPWFTREGVLRNPSKMPVKFKDHVLYGCTSLQALFDYFKEPSHEVDLKDCVVRVYEVPDYDVTIAGEN